MTYAEVAKRAIQRPSKQRLEELYNQSIMMGNEEEKKNHQRILKHARNEKLKEENEKLKKELRKAKEMLVIAKKDFTDVSMQLSHCLSRKRMPARSLSAFRRSRKRSAFSRSSIGKKIKNIYTNPYRKHLQNAFEKTEKEVAQKQEERLPSINDDNYYERLTTPPSAKKNQALGKIHGKSNSYARNRGMDVIP